MVLKLQLLTMQCNALLTYKNVRIWKDKTGKCTGRIFPKTGRWTK